MLLPTHVREDLESEVGDANVERIHRVSIDKRRAHRARTGNKLRKGPVRR